MLIDYYYQSQQEEDQQTDDDYHFELWRAEQLSMQQDGEISMMEQMPFEPAEPLKF